MWIDPGQYRQVPANRLQIAAGTVLIPTRITIVQGGGSSLDFVLEQGGDEDTFIFVLGVRQFLDPFGKPVDIIEGVFLSEGGPGFHATWDLEQLLREIDHGGWEVVPTALVLEQEWLTRVEARMNR